MPIMVDDNIDQAPAGLAKGRVDADPLLAVGQASSVEELIAQPQLARDLLANFFERDPLSMTDSYTQKGRTKSEGDREVMFLIRLADLEVVPAIAACASATGITVEGLGDDLYVQAFDEVAEQNGLSRYVIELLEDLEENLAEAKAARFNASEVEREYKLRQRLIVWYRVFENIAGEAENHEPGNGSNGENGNGHKHKHKRVA